MTPTQSPTMNNKGTRDFPLATIDVALWGAVIEEYGSFWVSKRLKAPLLCQNKKYHNLL